MQSAKRYRRNRIPWALAVWAAIEAGCTPKPDLAPLSIPEGCQPLAADLDCRLPYPSDFFRSEAEPSRNEFLLRFVGAAKPLTRQEYSADFSDWKSMDGFSRTPTLLALLGQEVSTEGLVGIFDDYAKSAASNSLTWIVDASTGTFVPHFVELDARAESPERQAILLHPMQPLAASRRYLVAIRGLVKKDGSPIPAPEGFRRLRDSEFDNDPALAKIASRFTEQVLSPLAALGVAREDLQLAWDFTTGRDESVMHDMLHMREQTLQALTTHVDAPHVTEVNDVPDTPGIWRKIRGTVEAPLFLNHGEPGAILVRDAQGDIVSQGTVDVPFTMVVPECVRDQNAPRPLLQFGHGFFYNQREVDQDTTAELLNQACAVGVAIDWWGMSSEDLGPLLGALGEQVWQTPVFTDRVHQAMMNWLTLTYSLEGTVSGIEAFHRPLDPQAPGVQTDPENPSQTNAGDLLFRQGEVHFLGISMGHILGGTYAALNPKLTRVILHVGGAGFSRIMYRAQPFEPMLTILRSAVADPVDQQWLTAQLQRYLDPIDPATWAPFVLQRDLPFGPSNHHERRQVLLQFGLGDTQVPNLSSLYHGRLLGLGAVGPQAIPLYDMQELDAPHDGSGLASFDLGVDTSFSRSNAPLDETSVTHNGLRLLSPPQMQMATFLRDGIIVHPCDGVCRISP